MKKILNIIEMVMVWIIDVLLDGMLLRIILYCILIKDVLNIYFYIIIEFL